MIYYLEGFISGVVMFFLISLFLVAKGGPHDWQP
jgi:hypothetical protein